MIRRRLVPLFLLLASPVGAAEEPAGYRESEYRAEVPATLSGATVVSTEAAHALWKTGQVAFIDVLPRAPKPENLPAGTVWNEKPRLSVPAALWLPNVGYGRLADVMQSYFRAGLEKATSGDKDRPMLFFCLSGCWMSWNAAKRAVEYGYTRVFWYPQGTDGWTAAGYPTERLDPEPGGQ
jgi:PQQ-dependent catabolism-associated CXXCW motif protein